MQYGFLREIPTDFDSEQMTVNGKRATDITSEDLPRFETSEEQEARWEQEEQQSHQVRQVQALLPNLSLKQKEAVVLFLEGYSYRQIAAAMQVNVRTAWEYLWGRKGRHGGSIRRIQKLLAKASTRLPMREPDDIRCQ